MGCGAATKRGEYLFKAAELLAAKLPQLGEDMTREEGKTLPEAIGEVTRAINIFRYFGGEGARQFSYMCRLNVHKFSATQFGNHSVPLP